MSDKKQAVGYVRCSTEMQEDSPEQQKKEIERFAALNGYTIQEWYIDFGKSGTTFTERPEFMRLKKVVESHPTFSEVICYDESRWGRAIDAEENTYWRVHFRKHGVDVLLVKSSIDPKHEFAPMLKAFEGVQASQYSKKLSELTLRGSMENGIFSNGGVAPYGYVRKAINLKTDSERILQQGDWSISGQEKVVWSPGDSVEVNAVRLIFEERIKGHGYTYIAMLLNQKSIPCSKRGRWRNKDQKWSSATIKCLIENHSYYGARVYNKNSMSKIRADADGRAKSHSQFPHWKNSPDKWVIVENAHEPLVSKEIWLKANSFRRPGGNKPKNKTHAPYLLSSLMVCSKCGYHYQGQKSGKKGYSYYRYVCGGYNSKGVCDFIPIKRDPLETFVLQSIVSSFDQYRLPGLIKKHLERMVKLRPEAERELETHLISSVSSVEQKLSNIRKAVEEGASYRTFQQRVEDLEREKEQLQRQIEDSRIKLNQAFSIDSVAPIVQKFMEQFEERMTKISIPERREVIRRCVDRIFVDHDKRMISCYVRKVPIVNKEVMDMYSERIKQQPATLRSPVVIEDVAGGGLEPPTYGL
jgi:hypothetical protein